MEEPFMSSLPIVAVVGATGNQGGPVVKALSESGQYAVRAFTRDPSKATHLANMPNVTVTQFDYSKPESINEALKGGVHALFAMTNFYDQHILANHHLEIEHGKRLVDAAVENGVKYFIWSTLPPASQISNNKYKPAHFDNKYEIAQYARSKSTLKSLFIHVPFYLQNFDNFLHTTSDGYEFALPMKDDQPLDYIDIRDLGKVVVALLSSPDKFVNRDIVASAGQASCKQFAEAFTRVLGKPTKFHQISGEEFKKYLPAHVGPELVSMVEFFSDFGYCGNRYDTSIARNELKVKFTSLDDWIANSKFAPKK